MHVKGFQVPTFRKHDQEMLPMINGIPSSLLPESTWLLPPSGMWLVSTCLRRWVVSERNWDTFGNWNFWEWLVWGFFSPSLPPFTSVTRLLFPFYESTLMGGWMGVRSSEWEHFQEMPPLSITKRLPSCNFLHIVATCHCPVETTFWSPVKQGSRCFVSLPLLHTSQPLVPFSVCKLCKSQWHFLSLLPSGEVHQSDKASDGNFRL